MASEVKDCEEETLQTAFKKLRVDAESPRAAARICEALAQKTEGGKSKGACPKENWHGCVRKTSRGTVRSQRRRRSKSPILHPPKFTYCSPKMSPPPGHLKHKSLGEGDAPGAGLGVPAKKELLSSGHASPVFGAPGYEPRAPQLRGGAASPEVLLRPPSDDDEGGAAESPARAGRAPLLLPLPERSAAGGAEAGAAVGGAPHADFRSLSRLQESRAEACGCEGAGASPRCRRCGGWEGVEVYSFTGLRDVISECERNLVAPGDPARASPRRRTQAGSPRSCSEQARAYVDDITIEDLSGYMEYYLYIPKKMSHMAEMMYT
ncbi:oxidative stress-responsive serine-rich protein 1 [Anguilla rostrata]|uniref:oxidative stress-responsive serine-rich protein 1 n=1 Tax=Anguilla rostrata TaxID=7938 RepID=UPI0030CCF786